MDRRAGAAAGLRPRLDALIFLSHTAKRGPMTQPTEQPERDATIIAICHRIMRYAGSVAVAAFVVIVAATTVSTAAWARLVGQVLYYVIVVCIAVSLVAWIWRVRLERRAG